MKKQIVLMAVAAIVSINAANAQPPGGFQRRTVEERVKTVHEKVDSAFKLDAAKMVLVDSVFDTIGSPSALIETDFDISFFAACNLFVSGSESFS